MDKTDYLLKRELKQELEKPLSYTNAIKEALNSEKAQDNVLERRVKLYKILAISCCIIFMMTTGVFAKDIINFVKNLFNQDIGMEKAINNGYIYTPDIDYIESSNISVKISNLLMDDRNFNFILELKVKDEEIDIVKKIEFMDLIITDESNNILWCNNIDTFNNFCEENKLDYKYGEFNEHYIDSGMNYYIKSNNNNTFELVFNLFASDYPKSKKINIGFNKAKIISDRKQYEIDGKWNVTLDMPEKFYRREAIVYALKACSDNTINITEASLYDTGMMFEFDTKLNPIYMEDDSNNVKEKKKEQFYEWGSNLKTKFVFNEYIIDENGKKYIPTNSNSESYGTIYQPDGTYKHWQTFNLTKYDNIPNELTIYFTMCTMEGNRDIIVQLERK